MKHEEIKLGDVYDVRVKVIKKTTSDLTGQVEIGAYTMNRATNLPMAYEMTWFLAEETPAFSPINSENGVPNSEPAPKYDPCRLFQKGDIVRVVKCKGRIKPYLKKVLGKVYSLDASEAENQIAYIKADDIDLIDVCHLELVTPVEDLAPYYVEQQGEKTGGLCFVVLKRNGYAESTFYFGPSRSRNEQQAKQAAEAECARLNAKNRKEQE